MTKKPRKRNRSGEDRSEWPMSTLLPPNNRPAGRAYVCALLGMIPALGLVLGPAGIVLGLIGYRRSKRVPEARGSGHAVASIVLGSLELITNIVGWWLIAYGLEWI